MELENIIKESFIQYSGAVLQSRALVDVRDGLKPSARQIFYSMLTHKLTSDKPHKKTMNAVGLAMADYYIHGDSSCEGIIMRAGQPFAMRYPLVDVKGNMGTLISSGSWAAPRYTESRLSKITNLLFSDIDKEVCLEWRDSYDNTKQYPAVLPSKGFYNLCNGTSGIGVGLASSIPQFNLKELNNALIYLIEHPDCDFEEIYCAPDFATGAILYNEEEVKESLKNGRGHACKLRSVVEFDSKDRCFIVTEIPYGVYTNTICGELEKIINEDTNPGVERFNDLTGEEPLIKIYLSAKANPDKVLKYLYKNTSLQYHYGINMTMLDNGRYPKVFTWKEALQAHLDHETNVYRQGFIFDLRRIKERLHIIEGLVKAVSIIDEVISLIKSAADATNAKRGLIQTFGFSEQQAKAILDIKLARLAHMEIAKLKNEQSSLIKEKDRIESILNDDNLLKKEIKKGLKDVAEKFGDERRTKIISLSLEENDEPIEIKSCQILLTNKNNLFVNEISSLYTQRRGGVGSKLKLEKGEYVISTAIAETNESILFFTKDGDYYNYKVSSIPIDIKTSIESLIPIKNWQKVCAICSTNVREKEKFIIFVTKNGMLKKSNFSEYSTNRQIGIKALALEKDDEIVDVIFTKKEQIGILTKKGNFVKINTEDVRALGRTAKGIKAIKLNDGDTVINSRGISENTKEILSISAKGLCKRTKSEEFVTQGKNTKGSKIQKLVEDEMIGFIPITDEKEILIASSKSNIKIAISEIPLLSRGAQGNKTLKLQEGWVIVGIEKIN